MKIFLNSGILLFLCTLLLALPYSLSAQIQANKIDKESSLIQWLTPIEVIRNIDKVLAKSRLEALEAGRGDAFSSKVNVAKSFVHSGDNAEAQKAYGEAIAIAWKRQMDHDLMSAVQNELERSKKSLVEDSRPSGLDENYQPISNASSVEKENTASLDKYEAGKKIDQALSFLYLSILKKQDQKLTLQGKLNYCRHLVELEEYELAKKEYHKAIISYLDPRWTSQLLEEIDEIIGAIEPSQTYSELNPETILTAERAIREIQDILKPIEDYYDGNAVLTKGVYSMRSLIRKGEHEKALAEIKVTLTDFAPASWTDRSIYRTEKILDKIEGYKKDSYDQKISSGTPILYSKSTTEGRTTETIRIIEDNELMRYKRVTHSWGGVYNFINDESAKDTEWLRVWKLYQQQEF